MVIEGIDTCLTIRVDKQHSLHSRRFSYIRAGSMEITSSVVNVLSARII
jgi:hypothetical protein